jgi:putative membrane protein
LSVKQIHHALTWLTLVVVMVFVSWLVFTNKLALFIHPRYNLFTAILMFVGFACVVVTVLSRHREDHEHDVKTSPARLIPGIVVLLLVLSAVVIAPNTLSSTFASSRGVNGGVMSSSTSTAVDLTDKPVADYQVKDWAVALQSATFTAPTNIQVELTGFIVPINENSFYVSRFVVYCCSVDAQPVGVPVQMEDWGNQFAEEDWVTVEGSFIPTPSSQYQAVLNPGTVKAVEQPEVPYEY